jgi:hypothetical protein
VVEPEQRDETGEHGQQRLTQTRPVTSYGDDATLGGQ